MKLRLAFSRRDGINRYRLRNDKPQTRKKVRF